MKSRADFFKKTNKERIGNNNDSIKIFFSTQIVHLHSRVHRAFSSPVTMELTKSAKSSAFFKAIFISLFQDYSSIQSFTSPSQDYIFLRFFLGKETGL